MNRKITAMIVVAVFLLVGGCSENGQSLLSPVNSSPPATSVTQGSNAKADAPEPMGVIRPGQSTNCAITLIPLPQAVWNSVPGSSSSGLITASSGGTLRANYSYYSILGKKVTLSATFTVPPGAVNRDTYVTMSFDGLNVGVDFLPNGLKFNIPAELDFSASGLDLTTLPLGVPVSLYFVNWTFEKQNALSISTNKWYGILVCKDAQIKHFSRYAFGY
jgi:hypothetical protein